MTSLVDAIPFIALAALASATLWRAPSSRLRAFAGFALVITAVAFLCSAATGRVDASDLKVFLAVALLPALLVFAFTSAGRLLSPWLRLPIRISSGLLTLPACALFLLISAAQATCVRRPPPLVSPDGTHVALLEIVDQGALGSSSAVVKVRPSWLPWSSVVYAGGGAWHTVLTLPIRRKYVGSTPSACSFDTGLTAAAQHPVTSPQALFKSSARNANAHGRSMLNKAVTNA